MANYVEELKKSIAYIRKETKAGRLGLPDRLVQIEEASVRYVLAHNEQYEKERAIAQADGRDFPYRPYDARLLEQLANLALYEELTDSTAHKSRHNEYPFLSSTQLERRQTGKHGRGGEEVGEAPLASAGTIATDMRDYRVPTRRKRSAFEDKLRDAKAKSRNAERRRKYREFTKEQPVYTYKMTQIVD